MLAWWSPGERAGPLGHRRPQQVRIVHLTAAAFGALSRGDLAGANAVSPVPLPGVFRRP
jgi:hypothetical protein